MFIFRGALLEGSVFYKKPRLTQRKQVASSVLVDTIHFPCYRSSDLSPANLTYTALAISQNVTSQEVPRNRHSCGINNHEDHQIHISLETNNHACTL